MDSPGWPSLTRSSLGPKRRKEPRRRRSEASDSVRQLSAASLRRISAALALAETRDAGKFGWRFSMLRMGKGMRMFLRPSSYQRLVLISSQVML